jgi:hypothetical protein
MFLRSPFFARLNRYDLLARQAPSSQSYVQRYRERLIPFTASDQQYLLIHLTRVRRLLRPYQRISSLPWEMVKVGHGIEGGYPHTLGDTIVLPAGAFHSQLYATLLHEQLHIYQRQFPVETQDLFRQWGYQRSPSPPANLLTRANPDEDGLYYSLNGVAVVTIYDRPAPTSITQTKTINSLNGQVVTAQELGLSPLIGDISHPNEVMAYEVANHLLGLPLSPALTGTAEWIERYL